MKVLVIYEPDLAGRLLIERLRQTSLQLVPLLLSRPEAVDPVQVGEWLTEDIDLVVNMLSMDSPSQAEEQPIQARHRLLEWPSALAAVAADRNIAMLQLSSCYVFDGRKQNAYLASNPGHPLGTLGQLLWESEQKLRSLLPRHIILRTGWPLRRFCQFVLDHEGKSQKMRMSSRYRGQPVTAADLARVIAAILQQIDCGAEVWGTYQYAGLEEVTLYELGLAITRILGPERSPHLVDDVDEWMALEPENATLNCKKIRNTFGIKPLNWRDALPQELEALQAHAQSDPREVAADS